MTILAVWHVLSLSFTAGPVLQVPTAGVCPETRRDGVCAVRLVARGHQPGPHHRRHTELLLAHQLPGGVAQDGARSAKAQPEVAPCTAGGWRDKFCPDRLGVRVGGIRPN